MNNNTGPAGPAEAQESVAQLSAILANLKRERDVALAEVKRLKAELWQAKKDTAEQVTHLEAELGQAQATRDNALEQLIHLEAELGQAKQNRPQDLPKQEQIGNATSIQVQSAVPHDGVRSLRNRTGNSSQIYSDHDDETIPLLGNNTNTQVCCSFFKCNKLSELFSGLVDCLYHE